MLKQQHRLTSDFEFKVTRKYGKKYPFDLFNVIVCKPLKYQGPAKFGIVVSNNYHKNAVRRNRIKRILREAIRLNIEKFPENYWFIFYPKVSCLFNENYEAISTEINKVLSTVSFGE